MRYIPIIGFVCAAIMLLNQVSYAQSNIAEGRYIFQLEEDVAIQTVFNELGYANESDDLKLRRLSPRFNIWGLKIEDDFTFPDVFL